MTHEQLKEYVLRIEARLARVEPKVDAHDAGYFTNADALYVYGKSGHGRVNFGPPDPNYAPAFVGYDPALDRDQVVTAGPEQEPRSAQSVALLAARRSRGLARTWPIYLGAADGVTRVWYLPYPCRDQTRSAMFIGTAFQAQVGNYEVSGTRLVWTGDTTPKSGRIWFDYEHDANEPLTFLDDDTLPLFAEEEEREWLPI